MSRIYFHIDLNAFFANAEVLLNPELKGKPIIVAGYSRRSVVSTASYEARKYGIHSAMPVSEALRLCKNLIIVEGHYHFYQELSQKFMEIVHSYTNLVEQASIDECYADVTETIMKFKKPLDLAVQMQKQIYEEIGIPCSIGIGPNLFLAKMASDMKKPLGITVLRIRDVEEKMCTLPLRDLRGIGNKTVPLLEELNIHTIGDLARYSNREDLENLFGNRLDEVLQRVHGYDYRELTMEYEQKSIGISETFLDDLTEYDELRGILRALAKELSRRMVNQKKAGSHITLRITYDDFRNITRSKKIIGDPIFTSDAIFLEAMTLFEENWDDEPIRLLGITMSDFVSDDERINLFNYEEMNKENTDSILKELNESLGTLGFIRASKLIDKEGK
ncbi:MAG: DNA polymerase IV [Solobacterium sp.]|nr:DNA polymerase IV [Solobacterium sp.]